MGEILLTKEEACELAYNYFKENPDNWTLGDIYHAGDNEDWLLEDVEEYGFLDSGDFEDEDAFEVAAEEYPINDYVEMAHDNDSRFLAEALFDYYLDPESFEPCPVFSCSEEKMKQYSKYMPKSVRIEFRSVPSFEDHNYDEYDKAHDYIAYDVFGDLSWRYDGEYTCNYMIDSDALDRAVIDYRVNKVLAPKMEKMLKCEDDLEECKETHDAAGMKKAFDELRSVKEDYKNTKAKLDDIYLNGLSFGNPAQVFENTEYAGYDMESVIRDVLHDDDTYSITSFEGGETPLSWQEKAYYKSFVDSCDKSISNAYSRQGKFALVDDADGYARSEAAIERREKFFTDETGIDYFDYFETQQSRKEWNEKYYKNLEREEEAMLYGTDEISFYSEDDFDF